MLGTLIAWRVMARKGVEGVQVSSCRVHRLQQSKKRKPWGYRLRVVAAFSGAIWVVTGCLRAELESNATASQNETPHRLPGIGQLFLGIHPKCTAVLIAPKLVAAPCSCFDFYSGQWPMNEGDDETLIFRAHTEDGRVDIPITTSHCELTADSHDEQVQRLSSSDAQRECGSGLETDNELEAYLRKSIGTLDLGMAIPVDIAPPIQIGGATPNTQLSLYTYENLIAQGKKPPNLYVKPFEVSTLKKVLQSLEPSDLGSAIIGMEDGTEKLYGLLVDDPTAMDKELVSVPLDPALRFSADALKEAWTLKSKDRLLPSADATISAWRPEAQEVGDTKLYVGSSRVEQTEQRTIIRFNWEKLSLPSNPQVLLHLSVDTKRIPQSDTRQDFTIGIAASFVGENWHENDMTWNQAASWGFTNTTAIDGSPEFESGSENPLAAIDVTRLFDAAMAHGFKHMTLILYAKANDDRFLAKFYSRNFQYSFHELDFESATYVGLAGFGALYHRAYLNFPGLEFRSEVGITGKAK